MRFPNMLGRAAKSLMMSSALAGTALALLPENAKLIYDGNSYVLATGTVGHSFPDQVLTRGKFRYPVGWRVAIAGKTMRQSADPANIAVINALNADVMYLEGPSNDLPLYTFAAIMADVDYVIRKTLFAAGEGGTVKTIVLSTTPPRWSTFALTAPQEAIKVLVDDAIRAMHNSYGGRIKIVDYALAGLVEADTIAPGTDGIHLAWTGAFKVGAVVAPVLNGLIVGTDPMSHFLDGDNLLIAASRHLFAGTGGTKVGGGAANIIGTVPTGWIASNPATDLTMTLSSVARGGGRFGQQVAITGTASTARELALYCTFSRTALAGQTDEALIEYALAAGSTGLKIVGIATDTARATYLLRNTHGQFTWPAEAQGGVVRTVGVAGYTASDTSVDLFILVQIAAGLANVIVTFDTPILRTIAA